MASALTCTTRAPTVGAAVGVREEPEPGTVCPHPVANTSPATVATAVLTAALRSNLRIVLGDLGAPREERL